MQGDGACGVGLTAAISNCDAYELLAVRRRLYVLTLALPISPVKAF
jgi:hypothetical protein